MSFLFLAEVSSGLEVTKEVSGIDPDDVIVECYEDGVKIIIEKSRFARLHSPDNLHFADPLCRGTFLIHSYVLLSKFKFIPCYFTANMGLVGLSSWVILYYLGYLGYYATLAYA